jgi:hypothetical protein
MTVQTVYFLVGRTGEQTHLHRVKRRQIVRLTLFLGHQGRQGEKGGNQQAKSPKKVIFLFHDAKLIDIFQ